MTTLTAPQQSSLHRPHTSTLVIGGFIVVILAVAALVIPRVLSTSTTTSSATTSTYTGGGGGNASHHAIRGHPGSAANGLGDVASAVAQEQVVAMQRAHLDGLLFQQSRLVDQGTPQAAVALKALAPQIVVAQKALQNAEKSVQSVRPQQTHTQN
jgi:pyridoxal/pyridoxine/pyridoxamine kinase